MHDRASIPGENQMTSASVFLSSSIGKKMVMAVTGVILFGFVVAHMVGNLQVYLGAEALNGYAAMLRKYPALLWGARIALLVAVVLHIWSAWSLTRANWAARPEGYRRRQNVASTYASRTMRWSGVFLAVFIVYHLMHMTFGNAHPSFVEGDVYHNFVVGFRALPVAIFYLVAMVLLGFHLYHGVWSMLQTLGISHSRYDRPLRLLAAAITAIVIAGNLSFPIAVLAGIVR
jgi:succinate dehydrogenase / fumarate reductase cytochrome b subunit